MKRWMWILLLAGLAWRGLFFAASVAWVNVSGDECIMALQGMGITQPSDSEAFQSKQHPRGWQGRFPLLFLAQPYLFPLESYLCAPFIRWLPRSEFGLRLIPAVMGFATFALMLFLVLEMGREWEPHQRRWLPAAALLAVFPSAYVLMLQSVYMLPGYPSFMLFGMLAVWGLERHRNAEGWNPLWAACSGLCAGLASSATLMTLPLLGGLGAASAGKSPRRALAGLPAYALGAWAGLLPFFLAKRLYPGAHEGLSTLVPWRVALGRLWNPALNFTLPGALGVRSTLMPDDVHMTGFLPEGALPVAGALWLAILLLLTVRALWLFGKRSLAARWPDVRPLDVLLGLCWVYPALFVLNARFGSHEFRYLLPVVLFVPLLAGETLRDAGLRFVRAIGAACAIMALINIATSLALPRAWKRPEFGGYFTDVRPAIARMRELGITHCYASYFDAYPINFLTNERILCAQPFNERFYHWPLPYADAVEHSTNVAYALGPSRHFRRRDFENDLNNAGIDYTVAECGPMGVYSGFARRDAAQAGRRIPPGQLRMEVSHNPAEARTLADGILRHQWRSRTAQVPGMWIELYLPEESNLERVRFYYNGYVHDHAKAVHLLARAPDGSWTPIRRELPWSVDGFDFVNGHPSYANQVQEVGLDGIRTDALRVEIAEANPGRDWTIGEIEVYERTP